MASVMDLALESEESVPYEPNLAMRAAVGFAHYLRHRGKNEAYDSNASELKAWYRLFGSDSNRFTWAIENFRAADRSIARERADRWQRQADQYGREVDELSWDQRQRLWDEWLTRNPRPEYGLSRSNLEVSFCVRCRELTWTNSQHYVPQVGSVCPDCFQNWTYCERCGEYYPVDEDHYHPPPPRQGSQCIAPMERFRMPNKLLSCGYQPSDRIVRVVNPDSKGRIAGAALLAIEDVVNEDRPSWDRIRLNWYENDLGGAAWTTRDGNYPKRLKNVLYKRQHFKLSASQMERIGNIARQYTIVDDEKFVEFTRKLDRHSDNFYHGDSCWFTGGRHRCILKQNGGMAMRLFDSTSPSSRSYRDKAPLPDARAWVVPLNSDLIGVNDPIEASSFLLFNAYGESAQQMASLLAAMTSKQNVLDVDMYDESSDGMYVNSGSYLVTDKKGINAVNLEVDGNNVKCSCVTWKDDVTTCYPYDDSDFSTVLISDRKTYEGEEEEPDE